MLLRQARSVVPFTLLIDEPAVESIGGCHFHQFIHHREVPFFVFGQESVQPFQFAPVSRLWEETGSDYLDAVSVPHIHYVGTGRHDQSFSGRSSPIHQQIHILQIPKSIGRKLVQPLGSVAAGAGVHDGNRHHFGLPVLGAVHRPERFHIRPLRQRNRAHVISQIRILLRIPLQQLLREPVGRLGLIVHDHLLVFVLLRGQIDARRNPGANLCNFISISSLFLLIYRQNARHGNGIIEIRTNIV